MMRINAAAFDSFIDLASSNTGRHEPVILRGLLCAAGAGGRVHPGWVASLRYSPPGMGQLWRSRRE